MTSVVCSFNAKRATCTQVSMLVHWKMKYCKQTRKHLCSQLLKAATVIFFLLYIEEHLLQANIQQIQNKQTLRENILGSQIILHTLCTKLILVKNHSL